MQKWILFAPRGRGAVHVCLLHRPGLFCRFRISVCVWGGVAEGVVPGKAGYFGGRG